MAASQPVAYTIEPFDPSRYDRAAFSCGVEQVDNYFQKTANKLAKADNVRLYVMVAPDGTVIGFYALNAHSVHFTDLPAKFARSRPSHGNIPAAYISMIGRDQKFRGGGYGGDLLVDALRRIAVAADAIGVAVVMLDVLDCGDQDRVARRKALYESYGFQSLASNPLRMYLPVSTVRKLTAEEDDWQKKEAALTELARLGQELDRG
jgi:ribosomal protein S18 acetylase RimI-like enzyme